jgi:hypothetical protein
MMNREWPDTGPFRRCWQTRYSDEARYTAWTDLRTSTVRRCS